MLYSYKILTTSKKPFIEAICRGDLLNLVKILTYAPFFKSIYNTSECP